MKHENLVKYYGQAMRIVMSHDKIIRDDQTNEGRECDEYLKLRDSQLEATARVRDAYLAGLLEDIDLLVEDRQDCRDLEAIARQRISSHGGTI